MKGKRQENRRKRREMEGWRKAAIGKREEMMQRKGDRLREQGMDGLWG